MSTQKVLLTIAGFDPSSGAGVTADLAVFAAHGYFGSSAITALTVQATLGVRAVAPVDAGVLRATLECLEEDLPPAGIKIGMLGTGAASEVVAEYLERVRGRAGEQAVVVLDPVLRSSSGRALLEPAGLAVMKERLLPVVDWVTPNLEELEVLSGVRVVSRESVEEGAERLRGEYPGLGILATGGHLESPDDWIYGPGAAGAWLAGRRVESQGTHGTGCAFSSALLAGLASGKEAMSAAVAAKEFVAEAIRRAPGIGAGKGPMELYWPLRVR